MIFLNIFIFSIYSHCGSSQDVSLFDNSSRTVDEMSDNEDDSLSNTLFLFEPNIFFQFFHLFLLRPNWREPCCQDPYGGKLGSYSL